jgi:aryl-alcohol dehydrogenase-like predicted oxidoreductase
LSERRRTSVAGTVKDLIREGKVRHFGVSEAGVPTIAESAPLASRSEGVRESRR